MQLETVHFPSDPDSAFGDLTRSLVSALHKASEHTDHHKKLTEILKYANKQLGLAKKDYEVRQKLLADRAAKAKAEEEAAVAKALEDKYVDLGDKIEELTDEQLAVQKLLGKDEE